MTTPRLTIAQQDVLRVLGGPAVTPVGLIEHQIKTALRFPRGGVARSLQRLELEGYAERAGFDRWQITEAGRARHGAIKKRSGIR